MIPHNCILLLICGIVRISKTQEDDIVVDTSQLSHVLDRLTNSTIYDKRLRPRYGDKPVDVGVTIHVSSISAVSEVDMDFTLDFYMRQTWQDPRLAFGSLDLGTSQLINELTVGVDYLDRLWKPDTFFPNEKKSYFHTATTHNSFLRIVSDGTVHTSQRLTVTATCPMKLQLFPMDSQRCKLEIESYGYTTVDITYFWGKTREDDKKTAVAFDKFMLPQFKQTEYFVNDTIAVTSSGKYARMHFEVLLVRNMGFYSMNIVIPSMLIVTISWVSFWLNREASPARVGLGVTTVLTMTTLITTTNNSMPKVSYIKGLDVFLNFCFIMVFASLVEYAVVSYMNKRIVLRREKRRKQAELQQRTEVPMFSNNLSPKQPNNNTDLYFGAHNSSMHQLMEIPVDCDCRTIPLIQHPRLVTDTSHTLWPAPFGKPKKAAKTCRNVTPAKIDKCSRYLFPLLFFGFNVGYWTIMTVLSSIAENTNKEGWNPIEKKEETSPDLLTF